ncbi:MAG: hypothetical protein M3P13_01425 [Acidobacteriota bacterium]|nr:hypothetical protein [Acidobacteriota bacterium]
MKRLTSEPTRSLGRLCFLLFAVSTAFLVVAGVRNTETPSRWLGLADVGVAALLVTVAFTVASRARSKVSDTDRLIAFRVSQALLSVIPVLLIAFFIAGDRINWQVLIVGLAWRGWLLLSTLPYLISVTTDTPAG